LRIVGQLIEDRTTIRVDLMFVAHEIREQNAPVGAHLAVEDFSPLMQAGFDFNTPAIASTLAGKVAMLRPYHGLTVPTKYFKRAMAKLREKFLK
jgi:hypothetical protein